MVSPESELMDSRGAVCVAENGMPECLVRSLIMLISFPRIAYHCAAVDLAVCPRVDVDHLNQEVIVFTAIGRERLH